MSLRAEEVSKVAHPRLENPRSERFSQRRWSGNQHPTDRGALAMDGRG